MVGELLQHERGSVAVGECREDGSFALVQACYELTDDNRAREFDGLVSAMRRFGLKSGVIVTHRQSDVAVHDGFGISIVPVTEYLYGTHNLSKMD